MTLIVDQLTTNYFDVVQDGYAHRVSHPDDHSSESSHLGSIYAAPGLSSTLTIVQCAALLEIVYAPIGFVQSTIFVTTMQVGPRIAALIGLTQSPATASQLGAGMMIIFCSLVEVPRQAFCVAAIVTGDGTKKTPSSLFWLRYSLFAVLYPTGITGELTVFLAAAMDEDFLHLF